MANEQQFGLEIKLLREQQQLSAKELAERVGLSPSQMSRLESGQRRVDAVLLSKIARALDVHPSYFFSGFEDKDAEAREHESKRALREPPLMVSSAPSQLGKLIRSERRRRHLTADELARKIGKGKSYVQDLESARTDMVSAETLTKIAKVLKLDAEVLLEAQRSEIRELRRSLRRLERAHTERTLGDIELEGPGVRKQGIPLVEAEKGGLPHRFDKGEIPEGRVLEYLFLPNLRVTNAFACTWQGDEMRAAAPPSFESGDLLVFSADRDARHRELVLAVLEGQSLFRRLYLDAKGRVRLQPLNLDFPPVILAREDVLELFPLCARVQQL